MEFFRDGPSPNLDLCFHGEIRRSQSRDVSRIVSYFHVLSHVLSHKCSHDDIGKLLRMPGNSFDHMYPEKGKEIKRMMLDYIKILRESHSQNIGDVIRNGYEPNIIRTHESGFPIAPRPDSWSKVTKAELEPIYRMYVSRNYRKFFFFGWPGKTEILPVCP
jgi:hypothetical protein